MESFSERNRRSSDLSLADPFQKRVLILEHDDDLRVLLVEAMSSAGFKSFGIKSIREFAIAGAKHQWDLALIDVNLPDGSGYAVARGLRSNTDTRIIILTEGSALVDRLEAHAAGGDAHIAKPPQVAEILAVADTILARWNDCNLKKPRWNLDDFARSITTSSGRSFRLTSREYSLMKRLIQSPNKLVENDEILSVISLGGEGTSLHALRMLLSRLRQRYLKEMGGVLPVETVIGRGLIFKGLRS